MSHSRYNVGNPLYTGTNPGRSYALDALPGAVAWVSLVVCVLGLVYLPYPLLTVAALLALYVATRFCVAIYANIKGLGDIRRAERTDWRDYYAARRTAAALAWDDVHHLVIVPNYAEPIALLRRTLAHLAACDGAERMTIMLAMEAREADAETKARGLRDEFDGRFARVLYALHPDGLRGESRCKSANQNWAARYAARRLVDDLGYRRDQIIVTTMDADTLWHPRYFAALTAQFATDAERYRRIWQAPIRYHANVHEINPLMRLVNAYATAFELAFLAANWWLSLPISSYSLSLNLLEACDYWDTDVIADEWRTYIKAFAATGGCVVIQPVFLPFLAQATTGDTFWGACRNRYRQSLRHGWGSKELGTAIYIAQKNRHIPLSQSVRLITRIAHDILLPGAGWIIVTVGAQMPFLFHPALRESLLNDPFSSLSYIVLQCAFLLFTVCGVAVWWIDTISRPPRHTPRQRGESALVVLGFFALPLMTFFFVALPLLQAQTRLILRDRLEFQVTAKQT